MPSPFPAQDDLTALRHYLHRNPELSGEEFKTADHLINYFEEHFQPDEIVRVAGHGESSDAHHISAPLPDGSGARASMQQALAMAGLGADDIDYINLHGTATEQNDAMESRAVAALFGDRVAVSSTKRLTGHTLGAAGAIEAALAWIALTDNPDGVLPPHWMVGPVDPGLPPLRIVTPGDRLGRPLRHVLSNSFAFGGSNATLILAAT